MDPVLENLWSSRDGRYVNGNTAKYSVISANRPVLVAVGARSWSTLPCPGEPWSGPEVALGGHPCGVWCDCRPCQSLPPNPASSCEHCGYLAPKDLSFWFLVVFHWTCAPLLSPPGISMVQEPLQLSLFLPGSIVLVVLSLSES